MVIVPCMVYIDQTFKQYPHKQTYWNNKFQHIHEQCKLAKGFEIHKFFYLEQNIQDQNTAFNVYINAKS